MPLQSTTVPTDELEFLGSRARILASGDAGRASRASST